MILCQIEYYEFLNSLQRISGKGFLILPFYIRTLNNGNEILCTILYRNYFTFPRNVCPFHLGVFYAMYATRTCNVPKRK